MSWDKKNDVREDEMQKDNAVEIEIVTDGNDAGAGTAEAREETVEKAGEQTAGSADAQAAENADAQTAENADAQAPEGAEEQTDAGEADGEGEELSRSEKKALVKKEAELADLRDRYMRTLAEYENFRKRTEKEKADIYGFAVKDVCGKILPVLDNLERGLAAVTEETKEDPFAVGMDQIGKQFVKALDDIGVKPIEAAGQPFDPNLHNAVLHVDDESLGDNVVAEELQKGYTYKGSVVRHSMVKVAN